MIRLLFASFDPRSWPAIAQEIRSAGDATPAILPMALVGTLAFSMGLLSRIPYAHSALVLLLTPWLFVSLVGASFALFDSCLLYTSPSPRD